MGKGGTIIEFVQQLYATEDVSRILSIIADVTGGMEHAAKRAEPPPHLGSPKEKPVIESLGQIDDRLLEEYVRGRAIPMDLARLYLQQISYRIGGRGYRALAFANDARGYEIRNP